MWYELNNAYNGQQYILTVYHVDSKLTMVSHAKPTLTEQSLRALQSNSRINSSNYETGLKCPQQANHLMNTIHAPEHL